MYLGDLDKKHHEEKDGIFEEKLVLHIVFRKRFFACLFILIQLPVLSIAQKIAAGWSYTSVICKDSTLLSWGLNDAGQTGVGSSSKIVKTVGKVPIDNVVAVVGNSASTYCLKSDSTVWAWGHNSFGQLGDSTVSERNKPVAVKNLTQVVQIDVTTQTAYAVKSDGTVWAWGRNSRNSFGDGSSQGSWVPKKISTLNNVKEIYAGTWHIFVLKHDGTLWGWGFNWTGQLGIGNRKDQTIPVQIKGISNIREIAAGDNHTVALLNDGSVWSWGYGDEGRLGSPNASQGSCDCSKRPKPILGLRDIVDIAVGVKSNFALKSDGSVHAWGVVEYRYAGLGKSVISKVPVVLPDFYNVKAIATSGTHLIAALGDGTVVTWGPNKYNQLGEGVSGDHFKAPVIAPNCCKVDFGKPDGYDHRMMGYVHDDLDSNCTYTWGEGGLQIPMVATPGIHYDISDGNGQFSLVLHDSIAYKVYPVIPKRLLPYVDTICQDTFQVYLSKPDPIDTNGFDFSIRMRKEHLLRVDFSTLRTRRCFRSKSSIYYVNEGSGRADSVKVFLQYPEFGHLISASQPYSYDSVKMAYVFEVDTLTPGEFGEIRLTDSIACVTGLRGRSQCVRTWIQTTTPSLVKNKGANGWDSASVQMSATCKGDTAIFTIYNTGTGDMKDSSSMIMLLDNVFQFTRKFSLAKEDTLVFQFKPRGKTIRLSAAQSKGHPGSSYPSFTLEACGLNSVGSISTGYLTELSQDDFNPDVSISCSEVTDSYDPNDKSVSPSGKGIRKIVEPGNLLSYRIRFQNTGSDTAYKVVVVDSLSTHLDISTLELGATSHPCVVSIKGEKEPVLIFSFYDIYLPQQRINELESNGFIKFRIAPKTDIPLGTSIENSADIFFDFNTPIRTPETKVVIDTLQIRERDVLRKATLEYFDLPFCYKAPQKIIALNLESKGDVMAYHWYKNNELIKEGRDSVFIIESDGPVTDKYHCELVGVYNKVVTPLISKQSVSPIRSRVDSSICFGEALLINGQNVGKAGKYTDTLQSWFGCDSVVVIDLEVKVIDTTLMVSSDSLWAGIANASYQWLYCDSSFKEVVGENGKVFKPSIAGDYAVLVTKDACTDTSRCHHFEPINTELSQRQIPIGIYPNPNVGQFDVTIQSSNPCNFRIVNALGRTVHTGLLQGDGNLNKIILEDVLEGVYFFVAFSESAKYKPVKFVLGTSER